MNSRLAWNLYLIELTKVLKKIPNYSSGFVEAIKDIPGVSTFEVDTSASEAAFLAYAKTKIEEEDNANPQSHTD